MEEDDIVTELYANFVFSIKIIRVIDNILVPSNIKFKMEFVPMDVEEDDINHAFVKIKYWLDNVINQSVIFSHDNSYAIAMFINESGGITRVGNVMVLTPGEPDDQHLAAIFQAKCQAIAGNTLAFGPVEVKSDNQLGIEYTFVGDSNAVLPKIEDWVGTRSFFEQPWWNRDDGSTLDILPSEDADLSVKPAWAFSFDFLLQPKKKTITNGTIVRTEFKPKVIDGGKSNKK